MRINARLEQFKAVAVNVDGCVKRRKRAHIAVSVAPLIILNSTMRRHSMTPITLGSPSSTGCLYALSDRLLAVLAGIDTANVADARLHRLHAEGLGVVLRRFPEPKEADMVPLGYDGGLSAAAVLGMRWPMGMGRLRSGVRPFRDKAEPP